MIWVKISYRLSYVTFNINLSPYVDFISPDACGVDVTLISI